MVTAAALLTLSLIAATPATAPETETEVAEVPELARLAADEVERLHEFFHDWFVGELPDTDEAYASFADALAEDFIIISPSGTVTKKADLLARLRESHSSGKEAGVKIWIRGFELRRLLGDDVVVVNYEEWQEIGVRRTGRVSTAVLKRDETAPAGIVWLHLHETWLPRPAVDQMLSDE